MSPHEWLLLAAILGTGAVGGVFFAFSTLVMQGLARLSDADGVAAMQSINITAVRPAFMTLLFGTAALSVALGVQAIIGWGESGGVVILAGCLLYLLGAIALTVAYHVPRNNALAALVPESAETSAAWRRYLAEWVRWNHVRAASSLGAAALFAVALRS